MLSLSKPDKKRGPNPRVHVLVLLAAFVVVIAGIKSAREIVLLMLVAVFLAVALAPPVFFFKRKGVPFGLALGFVMSAVLGIVGLSASLVGSSINDFVRQLPIYEQRVSRASSEVIAWLESVGVQVALDDQVAQMLDVSRVMSLVANLFTGVGGILANGFLILIMVIFLLLEASTLPAKLEAAFGDGGRTAHRFHAMSVSVNRYLAIKTWVSFATGLFAALLCASFGLDFALLWGLLAFLLNYIPNIGSIVAGIPPVLLAIAQLGVGEATIIMIGYIVINNILGGVIEPRVMGKGLGLSTSVVVVSLLFWGWVLGPVGMLLSVPLTMAFKIAMEDSQNTRWLATLLGSGAEAAAQLDTLRESKNRDEESLRRSDALT